jgi:hypothetical protein
MMKQPHARQTVNRADKTLDVPDAQGANRCGGTRAGEENPKMTSPNGSKSAVWATSGQVVKIDRHNARCDNGP